VRPPDRPDVGSDDSGEDMLVRPFLLTGGRTRVTGQELRVESLVQAVRRASADDLRFEASRIVELSRRPISIAELASALSVPFGVVRVLVGDLIDTGTVAVVQGEEISLGLLERIRDRVRAL
jgi:hypothetical protein